MFARQKELEILLVVWYNIVVYFPCKRRMSDGVEQVKFFCVFDF